MITPVAIAEPHHLVVTIIRGKKKKKRILNAHRAFCISLLNIKGETRINRGRRNLLSKE